MNEKYIEELKILRERLPIGIRHGLTLLEKTNGGIEEAEKLFQEEMIAHTAGKAGVSADIAARHLEKSNFDVGRAVQSIDEERYTLTELILRRCKDRKEEALDIIAAAAFEAHDIPWDFRVPEGLSLPREVYCVLTVLGWINYVDWEGFDVALSAELDIVTVQIENVLSLPELAENLRRASAIQELKFERSKNIKDYVKATNELRKNEIYQECENYYEEQRSVLIDRLYKLIADNIKVFP